MNQNIGFEESRFLGGLALLLPLIILFFLEFYKSRRIFNLAAGSPGENRALRVRYFLSHAFFLVFLACLLFALAGPGWGTRRVTEYRRGADLVFAVDLSRSMEIRDGPAPVGSAAPSRLEGALRAAGDLVRYLEQKRPGENRFALAMGKGRGILALPLSYDTEAVLALLAGLEDIPVSGWGTNLESLVDAAAGAFQDALPSRRLIILLSDGENLSGSLSAALERAAGRDIMVAALGMGSDAGAPVPPGPARPGSGQIPPEEAGLPPASSRRAAVLQDAAEHTGGIYVDGNREDTVRVMGEYIRSLSSETGAGVSRRERRPRWRLFVFGGLAALGLSHLARLRRRGPENSGGGENG
ncbi:MAG: VWA domain-containing protein [Treponema sp.]|nr:VWA domain-containing protein [Treponema sp.]